jgi:hypothetical protein
MQQAAIQEPTDTVHTCETHASRSCCSCWMDPSFSMPKQRYWSPAPRRGAHTRWGGGLDLSHPRPAGGCLLASTSVRGHIIAKTSIQGSTARSIMVFLAMKQLYTWCLLAQTYETASIASLALRLSRTLLWRRLIDDFLQNRWPFGYPFLDVRSTPYTVPTLLPSLPGVRGGFDVDRR